MTMCKANAEGAMCHHLGEGEVGGFSIEISLDDLEVWGNGAEVIVGFFVG